MMPVLSLYISIPNNLSLNFLRFFGSIILVWPSLTAYKHDGEKTASVSESGMVDGASPFWSSFPFWLGNVVLF